jgi:hypothetical protein
MARAAYISQLHKFSNLMQNGLLGRDNSHPPSKFTLGIPQAIICVSFCPHRGTPVNGR